MSRPLPSSFDGNADFYNESRWEKFSRKIKQEPLVPLGCALTVAALIGATRAMRKGDRERTNLMFRRRLYGQAFTLVAMVVGSIYWAEDRQKRKEYNSTVAVRDAQEKRDKWIKELEVRDEEEKAFQAKLARRKERQSQPVSVQSVLDAAQDKAGEAAEEAKAVAKKAVGEGNQNETRSVLEEIEKRNLGVLQAVKDLVAGRR